MTERFRVRVHAYVLMTNHYHLLLETPQANASRAMQWLNVSYSIWFNRKHRRCGPLFQGRFKSVLVDGEGSWALEASIYIHLNPVRRAAYSASKRQRAAQRQGISAELTNDTIRAQLKVLREWQWSSYWDYAGRRPKPDWLTCDELWSRASGGRKNPQIAFRDCVEERITQGRPVEMESRTTAGLVFGEEGFVAKVRRWLEDQPIPGVAEKPQMRQMKKWVPFETVKAAVERIHGEKWDVFRDRRGDWGRDMVLVLAHRHGGLTYPELAQVVGMKPPAVAAAIRLMKRRLADSRSKSGHKMKQVEDEISSIQT